MAQRALPAARALVALGDAYVAFARASPERFLLLFDRQLSRRRSLNEPVPETSAYNVLLAIVHGGAEGGELVLGGLDEEAVAYSFWALAHGMATLQLTMLEGFDADFVAADHSGFEIFVATLTPG